ncbi:MAG TPA: 2-C-methyl-D-erythritol 4-phosphate cytidylyltransferase [Actinomycetota bacterium]
MKAAAVVVAAGAGTRLERTGGVPKAIAEIAGEPMFMHSLRCMDAVTAIGEIVIVVPHAWATLVIERTAGRLSTPLSIVEGAATRGGSVREGLRALRSDPEAIVVHDAARPLVRAGLVERCLASLAKDQAAVCAVPVGDTVKRASAGAVTETVPRENLFSVQTPQVFRAAVLIEAHERAEADGVEETDDAALVERMGVRVAIVGGDPSNAKVTTDEDFAMVEALLEHRKVRR